MISATKIEIARETNHTCVKPFRCAVCNGEVRKGDRYIKWVGKWMERFYVTRRHLGC